MNRLIPLALLLLNCNLQAQTNLTVTVESAITDSDCFDIFSGPDIFFEVNVENQGWVTYPEDGACYTSLPNVQYDEDYGCTSDLPAQVEVCFLVFENDPIIPIGCLIGRSCEEQVCDLFDVPAVGETANYTLLLAGGTSTGELSFTMTVDGQQDNDLPCGAIDLGLLTRGDTLGDFTQGIYDNLCGTAQNEPDPEDDGGFGNQNGVWFEFTTDADIGSLMFIQGLDDPENTGDNFDLQVAVYESDNGACDGGLNLLSWISPNNTSDAFLTFLCPSPNTTYYVLVDGAISGPGSEEGVFGLQVINIDVDDAPDEACDAIDLGPVPEGGSVGLDNMVANFCATSVGDPFSPNYVVQSSVWFKFQAPASGHILVEAISDREIDSIGIQMGIYRALLGTCDGFFQHFTSQYTFEDLDESLEVSCLFPGVEYYILIDGDGMQNRGIFDLTVTDLGDITPVTNIDTIICAGESLEVAGSVYTEPGSYSDTLSVFLGCDSIVNTTLAVREPISVTINQTQPAIGADGMDGIAEVSASGGSGTGYSYTWCDGNTSEVNTNLLAGSECCVTATDDAGCVGDTCFTVEFITGIIPSFVADTLDCNGDENGVIEFSVMNGQAPYVYNWQNDDDSINGNGSISAEDELILLPDLPAGNYTITVEDNFFDTTFTVTILEPEPLELQLVLSSDASCFGVCDGALAVLASGGVGGYQYDWDNMSIGDTITDLCAQSYAVTVTDANSCTKDTTLLVEEPEEFIANILEVEAVGCLGDSTGVVTVETNGSPVLFEWNTGDVTETVAGLPAGTYTVEVENSDGCTAMATGTVTEPAEPIGVDMLITQSVSCAGATDANLLAVPSGPGDSFDFNWITGATTAELSGIGAGEYTVSVANENGCEASANIALGEPSLLQASASAVDITCLSGENGGQVLFDTTFGGTPPYSYSVDGVVFVDQPVLTGLMAGSYSVVVRDSMGCETELSISVLPPPVFEIDLGPDETINLGDSLLLVPQGANAPDIVYTWTFPDDSLKTIDAPSIIASPTVTSAYFVSATDTSSLCTATDVIVVSVTKERRVYIPNAFSPNADGRNDVFYVQADNAARMVKSLRIFSRTGNMVYETTNVFPNDPGVSSSWDGTFRGEPLDPAVFVYVAEIEFADGEVEVFQGDVVLLK